MEQKIFQAKVKKIEEEDNKLRLEMIAQQQRDGIQAVQETGYLQSVLQKMHSDEPTQNHKHSQQPKSPQHQSQPQIPKKPSALEEFFKNEKEKMNEENPYRVNSTPKQSRNIPIDQL